MKNKNDNGYNDFLHLVNKMSDEDKELFHIALKSSDIKMQSILSKKYGFICIPKLDMELEEEFIDSFLDCDPKNAILKRKIIEKFFNSGLEAEVGFNLPESEKASSIEELIELNNRMKNDLRAKKMLERSGGKDRVVLLQAVMLLKKSGCDYVANEVLQLFHRITTEKFLSGYDKKLYKKLIISEDRRNAGKKNEHKSKQEIINVMEKTWAKYPSMSQTTMIKKIRERYKVSEKSLLTWIKENGLLPPKPQKYTSGELVSN
ncbi:MULTISPECIES: hypothetical protein [Providencia]|uniref:hypothetical protein n=1 Tax=Providencia TaxID=586 RepID=UPI0024A2871B